MPENGLTESIREHGILARLVVTPIVDPDSKEPVVMENGEQAYRLISGERRLVNAIEAGLAEVPVEVRLFDDPADEIVALIEYNHAREETERQKVAKIETYKIALGERAKARSLRNLNHGETAPVPGGDAGEETGRTDALIAARLGITRRKVNDMFTVWSNIDRDRFFSHVAADHSPKEGMVAACIQRWDKIRADRGLGYISLSKAAQDVQALKTELVVAASGKKKKAEAPKEKKLKVVYPPRPLIPDDGFMEVWKMPISEEESVRFGMIWQGEVPMSAIVMRGHVVSIPFQDLFDQHGKLVLPTLQRPAEVEHETAQEA